MHVGFRPRLKPRPSLVDLLRRSGQPEQKEQQQQQHLESHTESVSIPSVDGPAAAASSHSPPSETAPLSATAANQELHPAPLALEEAQRIASTYQLPGSPSKLQQPFRSTTQPLSPETALQEQQHPQDPQPPLPSYSPNHDKPDIKGSPAGKTTAPPNMAPVSLVHFSNLPHRRQAPSPCMLHAACYPRHRDRDTPN